MGYRNEEFKKVKKLYRVISDEMEGVVKNYVFSSEEPAMRFAERVHDYLSRRSFESYVKDGRIKINEIYMLE